jgi:putative transposase
VNRKRTQRVMREHGLLVPQRRVPRGEHSGRIETSRCNEVWATDLSKIATREGWLWIVGVIDCHDRDLIGRRYGVTADTTLCLHALGDAVSQRFPDELDALKAAGPLLSHDWGSQFTSRRYKAELHTLGITSRPNDDRLPRAERDHGALLRLDEGRGGLDHRVRNPRRSDHRARRLDR